MVEFTPSCLALWLSSCVIVGALVTTALVYPRFNHVPGNEAFRATPHLFLREIWGRVEKEK